MSARPRTAQHAALHHGQASTCLRHAPRTRQERMLKTRAECTRQERVQRLAPNVELLKRGCVHLRSLAPLLLERTSKGGSAEGDEERRGSAFSQHPSQPAGRHRTSPCLHQGCVMGYSAVTVLLGRAYRCTEWVRYNSNGSLAPDWSKSVSRELYAFPKVNDRDDSLEHNRATDDTLSSALRACSSILRCGPPSGWGPWSPQRERNPLCSEFQPSLR